ncbi:MAG: hypothetical protein R3F37_09485 [Candidatus Competibacteraceae bacterium]
MQGLAALFTLPPEAAETGDSCFRESLPSIRYSVTVPTYLFATLRRLLPYGVLDRLLRRAAPAEGQSR